MLVRGRFLRVRLFPTPQIPDLKAAAPAYQRHFAFEVQLFAKVLREDEPPLPVADTVLGAGMQLAKENAPVAGGNLGVGFGGGAHTRKFLRRHDQEKLVMRFRKNDEFLGAIATPASGDGDAMFFVDGVSEFAGVERGRGWRWRFGRRIHVR